ncbi:MAG: hypothetical protein FJ006_11675 [Chloroflexi bacterium]|nr:hypothetical protein [Chloroflexota bacterium]
MGDKQIAGQDLMERKLKGDLKTQSGYDVKEVYGPEDIGDLDYERDLGNPGSYPFTRGTYPRMYREKLWVKGVPAGWILYALDQGRSQEEVAEETFEKGIYVSGARTSGDYHNLATIDPDHPLVKYDIGSCAGSSYAVWSYLPGHQLHMWTKILIKSVTEGFVVEEGHAVGPADVCDFAIYIALLERLGYDWTKLKGNMVNDPLHTHVGQCMNYKQPLEVGFRVCVDAMEWALKNTPKYRPTNGGCAYDMREAGINTIQELAFRFANYIEYTDELVRRGIKFEDFGHLPALAFSGEIDFFETICKLRAARRIYAKIAAQRYGADPKTLKCPPCNTNLAGDSMTAQQPIFNVIRNTIEAMASVLGGINGMELKGYTEALTTPPIEAWVVNKGIETIIAEEANIPLTADPLAGSYYVEWLTNKIEQDVFAYLQKILDMGGMRAAIKSGWIQAEVEKAAQERQRELEEGRKIKVCVNAYKELNDYDIPLPMLEYHRADPFEPYSERQKKTMEEFEEFKRTRDISKVKPALEKLYHLAKGDTNVFSAVIDAFRNDATIGEVMGVIRKAMGFPYDQFEMVSPPDFLELN